jgi:voltage-gated potassium channel Kch
MLKKLSYLKQFLFEARWFLLGGVWLAGLFWGYFGFALYSQHNELDWSTQSIIYLTLQLIILESGAVEGEVNWMLDMARFLLPALTAYTALRALTHLFSEQMTWMRLWNLQDHVIVCGLGRKGSYLTLELLKLGQRVVVIEQQPELTQAAELRRKGAIIIKGDALQQETLAGARLHRARYLICLLGQDHHNLQIAFQAYKLSGQRYKGILTCIIHLVSVDLLNLIKHSELSVESGVPFQIETFNTYASTARILIQHDPAWQIRNDKLSASLPNHILVVGLGRMGEHLIVQTALAWHKSKQTGRLSITILDRDAEEKTACLIQKYPQIGQTCQLTRLPVDLGSTALLTNILKKAPARKQIKCTYICLGNPVLSLQVCWSLLKISSFQTIPIWVRLENQSGLSELLNKPMTAAPHPGQIIPFDLIEHACSAELVVGGLHELLARELHQIYVDGIQVSSDEVSSTLNWGQLSEAEKDDNRQQANRIHAVLTAAGYQISPIDNWDAGELNFHPGEVEDMASLEHALWCQAKHSEGWKLGAYRDKKKRTHPDLVPWVNLPEDEQRKNREFIYQLPRLLAELGFQIDRTLP